MEHSPVFVSCCQGLLATCKIPFNGKALSGHWSYSLGFGIMAKCLHPLIIFLCFAGTARLPEASENPLLLKQVVRKPLEAVLRYLGIKQTKPPHAKPPKHRKHPPSYSADHLGFPFGSRCRCSFWIKNKQTKKTKPQRTPTPQTKHKPHPSNVSFLLFLLNLTDPVSLQSTLGAIKLYQKLFQVKGGMCLLWLLMYMWTSYRLLMEALTSCFGNI